MSIWIAILLGIVQGIAEFLPISSSGHLMVTRKIFSLPENMVMFDIILHLATLGAVILVFRKTIWALLKRPFCHANICLLIATAISCAMVLVFNLLFEVDNMPFIVLPFTFAITGAVLLVTNAIFKKFEKGRTEPSYKSAIIAGIAQGIAVLPGISRSGSTICASMLSGMRREAAAEFAFLMSIPIIVASFVFEIVQNHGNSFKIEIIPTLFGAVFAFVSAVFAIKLMLAVIKRVKLYWFSVYLFVLAAVCLVLNFAL
jgi:undecaprenyl-diphosphatase